MFLSAPFTGVWCLIRGANGAMPLSVSNALLTRATAQREVLLYSLLLFSYLFSLPCSFPLPVKISLNMKYLLVGVILHIYAVVLFLAYKVVFKFDCFGKKPLLSMLLTGGQ